MDRKALNNIGTYEGTPTWTRNRFPGRSPSQGRVDLWFNEKWINYQMMQGTPMTDIGAPNSAINPKYPGMPVPESNFYQMELAQTANYANIHQVDVSSWDLRIP